MIDLIVEVQELFIKYLNSEPDILLNYHNYGNIDFDLRIPSGNPDEPDYIFSCMTYMRCRISQIDTSTLMYIFPCYNNYKSTEMSIGDFTYYYGAGVLQIREYKLELNSLFKTLCDENKYTNIFTHDDLFSLSTIHSPEHLDKLYELHTKSQCSTILNYDSCTENSLSIIGDYLKNILLLRGSV